MTAPRRILFAACAFVAAWTATAADPNPPTLHSTGGAWPIHRQWTQAEIQHYADWVEHIYEIKTTGTPEQQLAKLERVLTDPEINLLLDPDFAGEGTNPQLDVSTIRSMHKIIDCAKLTVAFSSYYAYRRALPWMITYVKSGDGTDLRTADYTVPVGEMDNLTHGSVDSFFINAVTGTCTGNFRVDLNRNGSGESDTLPVAIDRAHLLPGCLYYLDGHVLILARIEDDGSLRFLDSTVSPTRHIYTYNGFYALGGSSPKKGNGPDAYYGCYRGFRTYRWPVAETDSSGKVTHVRRRTDAEMAAFGLSTEQYDKLAEITQSQHITDHGNRYGTFEQFVRARMRSDAQYHPVADIQRFAADSLAYFTRREALVQAAWKDVADHGPIEFPEAQGNANIYTAPGRWGQYATALDDAAWRTRYFQLLERLDAAIGCLPERPGDVDLSGMNASAIWGPADLAASLLQQKNHIFLNTRFTITDGNGTSHDLNLRLVEQRFYDMSFDPNHPPEVRWGNAPNRVAADIRKAVATPVKANLMPLEEAYQRQAYYRSLARWEPEESYLTAMATEGFPHRPTLDEHFTRRWMITPSPPLVPVEHAPITTAKADGLKSDATS